MNNTWRWIIGIVAGLALFGLLFAGHSERQAYRIARGAVEQRDQLRQQRIDATAQMAMESVDLALSMSAGLPIQEDVAGRIKKGIEETSDLLKQASDTSGDAAVELLKRAIDAFNKTLEAVDDASNKADNPEVKAKLDQIHGVLLATKEQVNQAVLSTQK